MVDWGKGKKQGAQGFVKLSISTLRGDEKPKEHSKQEQQDDTEILQQMILKPPSLLVEDWDLSIKVYKADNLQHLKQHLEFSSNFSITAEFASIKEETEPADVKEKDWNQELILRGKHSKAFELFFNHQASSCFFFLTLTVQEPLISDVIKVQVFHKEMFSHPV